MARKIVCDRCDMSVDADANGPKPRTHEISVRDVQSNSLVTAGTFDLCTDCTDFVAAAIKMAVAPVVRAPGAAPPVNDDVEIKFDRYGHPTYAACGCYVTEHPPGRCNAKARVMPEQQDNVAQNFAPAPPYCGRCNFPHAGPCAIAQPQCPQCDKQNLCRDERRCCMHGNPLA